jgi:hypothetical protein
MTIRPIWKMRRTATHALVLAGLFAISVATGITATVQSGTFTLTGSLNTARYDHTATLLGNGGVLVTGGLGVSGAYTSLASAELYSIKKGKWTVTGSMSVGRTAFTATLLQNGDVLVAGGSDYEISCYDTAELYNPSTGQWTLTGSMTQLRCHHSATLLPSGEVLVSGGAISIYNNSNPTVASSEIYNPSTGEWTATGSLNDSRASAATVLLQNGEVFTAGGYFNAGNGSPNAYLTSAELYDPSSGTWRATASISGSVGLPTTPALLPDGDMLIANDAQFYDPATATWITNGPLPTVTFPPTKAAALGNGNVLGTGNECKSNKFYNCGAVATTAAFPYSFSGNSWSQTGSMNYPRFHQTMTLLPNGQVLVAGGGSGSASAPRVVSIVELYTP